MASPTMVNVGSIVTDPYKSTGDALKAAGSIYSDFHKQKLAVVEQNMKIDEENRQRGIRRFLADYDPSQSIGKDGFGLDAHTIKALEDSERTQIAEYEKRRKDGTTDETPEEFQQRLSAVRKAHVTGESIKRDIMRQLTARGIGAEEADKISSQYSQGYVTQKQLLKEEEERVKALNEELKSRRTFMGNMAGYDATSIANWNSANVRGGDSTSTTYGGGSGSSSSTSGNAKGSDSQYAPMAPETYDLVKERGVPWTNFRVNPFLKGEDAAIKEMQMGMNAYNAIANNQKPDEQGNMPYITGTVGEYMRFLDEHRGQAALSSQPEMLSKESVADLMRKDFTRWVQIDRSKRGAEGGRGSGSRTTVKSSGVDKSNLLEPVRYASEEDIRGVKESQVYLADSWDEITRKRVEASYKDFLPVLKAKQASGEWPIRKPAKTDVETVGNQGNTGNGIRETAGGDEVKTTEQRDTTIPKNRVLEAPPVGIARNEASEATAQARQQAFDNVADSATLPTSRTLLTEEEIGKMSKEGRSSTIVNNIIYTDRLDKALSGDESALGGIKKDLSNVSSKERIESLDIITQEMTKKYAPQIQSIVAKAERDRFGKMNQLRQPKEFVELREKVIEDFMALGLGKQEATKRADTVGLNYQELVMRDNTSREQAARQPLEELRAAKSAAKKQQQQAAEKRTKELREAVQRSILTGDSLQDQNSRAIGNFLDNIGTSDIVRSAPPATRENQERITARKALQAQEEQAELDAYRLQLDQTRKELDRDQALNQQYQGVSFTRGLTGYPDVEIAAGIQKLAKQSARDQLTNYTASQVEQGVRKTIQNVPVGIDGITERPIELTEEEVSTLPKELQVSVVASNITSRDNWRKNTDKRTSLTDVEPMLVEAEDIGRPEVAEAVLDRLSYASLQEMVNRVSALETQWLNGKIHRSRYNAQLGAVEDHLKNTAEKLFPFNVQAQREYYLNFEQLRRGDSRPL
jgi:hypothetical protein